MLYVQRLFSATADNLQFVVARPAQYAAQPSLNASTLARVATPPCLAAQTTWMLALDHGDNSSAAWASDGHLERRGLADLRSRRPGAGLSSGQPQSDAP